LFDFNSYSDKAELVGNTQEDKKAILAQNMNSIDQAKDYLNRNRYGLMGTLAFHMVLVIILLIFKMNSPMRFVETEILLAIPDDIVEQIEIENKRVEEKKIEVQKDKVSQSVDEMLRSIAVNQDLKTNKTQEPSATDLDKMIDDIKQELEGYESENDRGGKSKLEAFKRDSIRLAEEREKLLKADSLKNIEYSGPSSVFYSLKGRHKLVLPIPVFKCEGSGRVRVEITVNRQGKVIKSSVIEKESDTYDDCLFEAALNAAYRSRFNIDNKSPQKQIGSITFNFIKQ